jgi:PHP family Zn ribbon phosphoesterase
MWQASQIRRYREVTQLKKFACDLHIHTCLSPCADDDMTPINIINMAELIGLDIIAITDHNSCRNLEAAYEASAGHKIFVIPGMEVTTKEDIHIICLLPDIKRAMELEKIVYDALPREENSEEVFGRQLIVGARGEVIDIENRLLLGSTTLSIDELFIAVHELCGLFIPAHVDRPNYSIISSLGFIPPEMDIPVVEISKNVSTEKALQEISSIHRRNIIQSSDAHSLGDLLERQTFLYIEEFDFEEIKKAFYSLDGRKVTVIKDNTGLSP